MSFFRPEVHPKEKDIKQHPWARTIKDNYSSKIKHAHNSIRNPTFPKLKEKQPASDRAQFTIIGDRVTKEFIFCTKLVKGLFKYRWKNFEAPIIRGVNTVEWPAIWNDLKIRYGGIVYCLKSSILVLLNNHVIGGEKELKELVETKYVYHLCLDYYNESVAEFAKFIRSSGRPCAYMHISIDGNHIGSLIFMLFADIVPYTCENFLRLCNEKRGGYGGTPVHRIVKDGWIQCGGFGLKSTSLDCENYIVPLDKRGVLGMSNDGRNVECSTQFFVLLQPAPWMAQKYVAFGELIEGEATLKQIESVSTYHESPTSAIIIYQAGIFNMECHDIMINKNATEYIHGHIENLVALGDAIWEYLLERVFLEAQLRETTKLEETGEGAEGSEASESGIRATQRFNRKKEEIQQQIGTQPNSRRTTTVEADINNDFDVEEYEYEPEHSVYSHLSLHTPSLIVKPEIPYYIPLTDVPYPGEVDSNFDLKRLLQGDYCLESDLQKNTRMKAVQHQTEQYSSEMLDVESESESVSEQSLDSDDEKEIKRYIKMHVDRVSFAGGVIKTIARGKAKFNIFEKRKSEYYSDEDLRRMRIASVDSHAAREGRNKKVSISAPNTENEIPSRIKRRQTGFVRPEDLEKIHVFSKPEFDDDDDDDATKEMSRKVRISAPDGSSNPSMRPQRRPTGFIRPLSSDEDVKRQSVLSRLYDEVTIDDYGPTLKDYKPLRESHRQLKTLLTYSPNARIIKSDEDTKQKYMRHSLTVKNESFEQIMNLQHGKKVARKISSDYVKTIDQIEHKLESSLRSVEFARLRPAISVTEYQMKNKIYQEGIKLLSESQMTTVMKPPKDFNKTQSPRGIRLPGDTPLYSMTEINF